MARLKDRYTQTIVPELKKALGTDNIHALPRLDKIVVQVGMGKLEATISTKALIPEKWCRVSLR